MSKRHIPEGQWESICNEYRLKAKLLGINPHTGTENVSVVFAINNKAIYLDFFLDTQVVDLVIYERYNNKIDSGIDKTLYEGDAVNHEDAWKIFLIQLDKFKGNTDGTDGKVIE